MSYTLAKTMVEKLGTTVRDFEIKTGNTIMTTDFIQQKMNEAVPVREDGDDQNVSSH
jgi:hypothetical protein